MKSVLRFFYNGSVCAGRWLETDVIVIPTCNCEPGSLGYACVCEDHALCFPDYRKTSVVIPDEMEVEDIMVWCEEKHNDYCDFVLSDLKSNKDLFQVTLLAPSKKNVGLVLKEGVELGIRLVKGTIKKPIVMITLKRRKRMRVFLGGTCAESTWRDDFILFLESEKIDYFNPIVGDWTPECRAIEEQEKIKCDVHLYVITPKMEGFYSIAELIHDACTNHNTVFVLLRQDGTAEWSDKQMRSWQAIIEMLTRLKTPCFTNMIDAHQHFRLMKEGIR